MAAQAIGLRGTGLGASAHPKHVATTKVTQMRSAQRIIKVLPRQCLRDSGHETFAVSTIPHRYCPGIAKLAGGSKPKVDRREATPQAFSARFQSQKQPRSDLTVNLLIN